MARKKAREQDLDTLELEVPKEELPRDEKEILLQNAIQMKTVLKRNR